MPSSAQEGNPDGAKPRVLLADDHSDVLEATRTLLSHQFDVVGAVGNGAALLDAAERLLPDVVVTDIKMPQLDGIEAGRKILKNGWSRVVVALSIYNERQIVEMALAAGIRGYVLKQSAGEDLETAIHLALKGGIFVSPELNSGIAGQ